MNESDIKRVVDADKVISDYIAAGWSMTESLGRCDLRTSGAPDPKQMIADIQGLGSAVVRATVVGKFEVGNVSLAVAPSAVSVVSAQPSVEETFAPEHRSAGRAVWAGDFDRITDLPPSLWSAEVTVDLGRLVDGELIVCRTSAGLVQRFTGVPFWEWGALVDAGSRVLVLDAADSMLRLPALAVVGPSAELPPVFDSRDPRAYKYSAQALAAAPTPSQLQILEVRGVQFNRLLDSFRGAAAALALASFGTMVELDAEGQLSVEIFGLQRTKFKVPPQAPAVSDDEASAAVQLFEWASAGSVDHILAVRQVASLRTEEEPWRLAADIQTAAELVVVGLRSDAIADVLRSRRELVEMSVQASLRSSEAATAMSRAAVERTVVALLGVAGVVVAQSLQAVGPELATALRGFLATVLFALAAWSAFLEGPFTTLPIATFRSDIATTADLLSEQERRRILDLDAISRAWRRGVAVRIAVPAVYIVAALGAILVPVVYN